MPWDWTTGKAKWLEYPWVSNPNYKEEMMSIGKGPKSWHRFNTWKIQLDQVSGKSFIFGEGTNPVDFPDYSQTDEQNRIIGMDAVLGRCNIRKKIWSETEGLLADPLDEPSNTYRTYQGSWATNNDVRLRSREMEILGIIDANPHIKIKELCLIYNTTRANILRVLILAKPEELLNSFFILSLS